MKKKKSIFKILKETFTTTFLTMRCASGNPLKNIETIVNKSIKDINERGCEEDGNNEQEEKQE